MIISGSEVENGTNSGVETLVLSHRLCDIIYVKYIFRFSLQLYIKLL